MRPSGPLSRAAIRGIDRRAIEEFGIPGIVLMENAAIGCDRVIEDLRSAGPERFGQPYRIVCGPGNNGGDGFALARHLRNRGLEVEIHLVEARERIRPGSDAEVDFGIALRMGIPVFEPGPDRPVEAAAAAAAVGPGTIIDAMLGTGLDRPLRSPYLEWVRRINGSGRAVVAIDIPTGLDADTGQVLGDAVRADATITMAARKIGFDRGEGPARTGMVFLVGIGIEL